MLETDHLLCKALEALIMTLRTHLARLTSELSSHQQLLRELWSLRESDARTLKEKSEVERLREEVERLADEVEMPGCHAGGVRMREGQSGRCLRRLRRKKSLCSLETEALEESNEVEE
jgi:hypothetical protein